MRSSTKGSDQKEARGMQADGQVPSILERRTPSKLINSCKSRKECEKSESAEKKILRDRSKSQNSSLSRLPSWKAWTVRSERHPKKHLGGIREELKGSRDENSGKFHKGLE